MNATAPSTRTRALFHGLLAVAIAGATGLSSTSIARASSPADVTIEWQFLEADPAEVTLCTNDQIAIGVRAVVQTRRFTSSVPLLETPFHDTRRSVGNQAIFANVANVSVGHIEPSGLITSMTRSPIGWNQYTLFAGEQPGHTQATFSSPPAFDPVTVEVEVKKCKYRIQLDSAWAVERGFLPFMWSHWDEEVTPDGDFQFDVLGSGLNQVYWRSTFACPHTVSATTTKARVRGGVLSGQIHFTVDYDPIPGMAQIPCEIGIWQSTGENQDTSTVTDISLARLDVHLATAINQSVRTTMQHDLVMPDGTTTGSTTITVMTEPQ